MRAFFLIVMVTLMIIIPSNGFSVRKEEPIGIRDYKNIISEADENKIRLYSHKISALTRTDVFVGTFESADSTNVELENMMTELNNKNSVLIMYYEDEGSIDIKAGSNLSEILNFSVIEQIKGNEELKSKLTEDTSVAITYLTRATIDKVLIYNGYLGIEEKEKADRKNELTNTIFYVIVGILMLVVLFISPISPYNKRKKNGSIYVPPNPYGSGFYGGGHTLGGDFTNKDKQSKD